MESVQAEAEEKAGTDQKEDEMARLLKIDKVSIVIRWFLRRESYVMLKKKINMDFR